VNYVQYSKKSPFVKGGEDKPARAGQQRGGREKYAL